MEIMRARITAGARVALALAVCATALLDSVQGHAQSATVDISIKNHRFQPAEIHAPAGTPITIRVRNLDPTPMEFESVTLRVEKIVPANSEGVVNVRALSPGRYNFIDDFNQQAKGVLVVQ